MADRPIHYRSLRNHIEALRELGEVDQEVDWIRCHPGSGEIAFPHLATNPREVFLRSDGKAAMFTTKAVFNCLPMITSQHRETRRNLPHYSASKAGMTMVMKELARVLAPDGIRVNAIAPGAIPGGGFVAGDFGALVAQIPLGRAGTPDDIAQVAVAVLSERFGRYIVGTTVEVDGGIGLMSWIPPKA